jgi:hypothetical protein
LGVCDFLTDDILLASNARYIHQGGQDQGQEEIINQMNIKINLDIP